MDKMIMDKMTIDLNVFSPFMEDACSLPSTGDRSNIILGVLSSNHKEQGKFKDNIIKQ